MSFTLSVILSLLVVSVILLATNVFLVHGKIFERRYVNLRRVHIEWRGCTNREMQ